MSHSQNFKVLKDILIAHFWSEFYDVGIRKIREYKSRHPQKWNEIKQIILDRLLNNGEALSVVHDGANQVLDENTEEEAYKWLDLFVENVDRDDGIVKEY